MPIGRKRYLKPRELAQQSMNLYELQKKQNIEKNNLVLESMGLKHMAHALFSSNKDGKTASTSDGKTACEVDEGSSSSDEDKFSRQQTHHENGDPPIITGIYEEASTEERKKKRVRGPTIGKAVVQMIKKNEGNRIPVVVLPEMRAFCGINASCVANEFGVQIRRICPTEGFAHSWNSVDSTVKEAIMQAIRDKFQITDEDVAEDSELIEVPIKNGQNSVISGKGLIHLQRLARGLKVFCLRASKQVKARECSSVPVPSNTWVLLVLNWKLGAGTSLALLDRIDIKENDIHRSLRSSDASIMIALSVTGLELLTLTNPCLLICYAEDGGLTYGLFLQVAETLASFVLIFFLLVADDLLKSTTIDKIPSDLEGMKDSMEKLLALVDGSYKLYVDDVVVLQHVCLGHMILELRSMETCFALVL
ncbi:hypothetical protein Dimus_030728 [Dionaea muscipula]